MNLSNEIVIHQKKGGIEYLQFRKLLSYEDKISHCISLEKDYTRNDGKNYKQLLEQIELKEEGLISIKEQIHSNIVETVENSQKEYTKIDGLITQKKGITLSTREADCVPILLYDPIQNVIANIHSGWRGTVQKIAQEAVKKMIEEFGCQASHILCAIGPCIRKCHFEVNGEVKEQFEKVFSRKQEWLEEKKQDTYVIDIPLLIENMLEEVGILKQNIEDCKICTVCQVEKLNSYRVDGDKSGRNTAIIGLK